MAYAMPSQTRFTALTWYFQRTRLLHSLPYSTTVTDHTQHKDQSVELKHTNDSIFGIAVWQSLLKAHYNNHKLHKYCHVVCVIRDGILTDE
jgi:hypothetical protein